MPKVTTGRDSCVACDVAGGELCGPTATEGTGYNVRGIQFQCVKRASDALSRALDCCNETTGQCERGDNEGALRASWRCVHGLWGRYAVCADSRGGVCVTNPIQAS